MILNICDKAYIYDDVRDMRISETITRTEKRLMKELVIRRNRPIYHENTNQLSHNRVELYYMIERERVTPYDLKCEK